jgi:pimeloyl-ACP methyl ester carboxylesterase
MNAGAGHDHAGMWGTPQRLRAHDGTDLAYYTAGSPDAPAMVLCPGLGGSALTWRPFVERFGDRFRVLCWDYRGLYRSGPASDPNAYGLTHHVRDLSSLLEHEGVASPLLVGWSMGVQVGLELHREQPKRAAGFVAIHGTSGRPLDTAFGTPLVGLVAPAVLAALRQVGDRFSGLGPRLTRSPIVIRSFVRASQLLGLMADEVDVNRFRDMAEEWCGLDLRIYAEIFDALGEHDASDLLESIETPTLLIAGGCDRLTPAHVVSRIAERMSNARLEIVPGATHFGLLEFPDAILKSVEEFLRTIDFGDG